MGKEKFIDLGIQPLANGFLTADEFEDEYKYNLSYSFDSDTCMVKQDFTPELSLMFNEDYPYHTSGSTTMAQHFKSSAHMPNGYGLRILEIGSNDGAFICNTHPTATKIAVEPCGNFAKMTQDRGVHTYNKFWNMDTAYEVYKDHGPMDLIFSANCMCHIPDLDNAFRAISMILKTGGTFIFEDPSLASMILNCSFDQLYDEHVWMFTVMGLNRMLVEYDLYIHNVRQLPYHGGSNQIIVKKGIPTIEDNHEDVNYKSAIRLEQMLGLDKPETYIEWGNRIEWHRDLLCEQLSHISALNKVISYGATSKSTTVFNYMGFDTSTFDYITDTTPAKIGKFAPGTHIPIVSPEEGLTADVDYMFLGAWNFAKEIMEKEKEYAKGKTWVTHVPYPKFIKG
tara:strand:+ start:281 stop:1468 length:1188 start_codon:yes stop_codon:yes gene_type:complete